MLSGIVLLGVYECENEDSLSFTGLRFFHVKLKLLFLHWKFLVWSDWLNFFLSKMKKNNMVDKRVQQKTKNSKRIYFVFSFISKDFSGDKMFCYEYIWVFCSIIFRFNFNRRPKEKKMPLVRIDPYSNFPTCGHMHAFKWRKNKIFSVIFDNTLTFLLFFENSRK